MRTVNTTSTRRIPQAYIRSRRRSMSPHVDTKTLPGIIREKTDNSPTIGDILDQVVFADRDNVRIRRRPAWSRLDYANLH